MSPHAIQLRRAWALDGRRVDLPTTWPGGPPGRITLTRRFNRPPIVARAERLTLRLRSVPGLSAVRLNGVALARDRGEDLWLLPPEVPAASSIELDAEPPGDGATWGEVALLIEAR